MTDQEQRKLKNQLRRLRELGLPPDKSFISLLATSFSQKHKLEKQKNLSII